MAIRIRNTVITLSVLFVYFLGAEFQFGCGPIFEGPQFYSAKVPDHPPSSFMAGRLGVVSPDYLHQYLFMSYRNLAGIGFTEEEQKAMFPWDFRDPSESAASPRPKSAIEIWKEARRKVPGAEPAATIDGYRYTRGDYYAYYLNCPAHAFLTAADTLAQRIETFGADSSEIRQWLAAQDQVFENCSGGPAIPQPAEPASHPLVRADRAYQIAAAHFYSGDFDEAEARFRGIAKENESPWKVWAPYLVGRALIRKATLGAAPGKLDQETMAKAEAQLVSVLQDDDLEAVHSAAEGMLEFVRFRLYPQQTQSNLANALLEKSAAETLPQNWQDYDLLLDRGYGREATDDLTDWLHTMRGTAHDATHAVERWKSRNSLPWLVAALVKIDASHPSAGEILDEAAKLPPASPGFVTAAYHRFRIQLEQGKEEETHKQLDDLLARNDIEFPVSSRNLFLEMRLKLARNLEEFLQSAPREVSGFGGFGADPNQRVLLDTDSLAVFNTKLPLKMLATAAKAEILPPSLRREIALAAWARAALLEKRDVERDLAPLVEQAWPELKAELQTFSQAPDGESRRFAMALLMLRFPGVRPHLMQGVHRRTPIGEIDNFRENWWCAFDPRVPMHEFNYVKRNYFGYRGGDPGIKPPPGPDSPSFLDADEVAGAREEVGELRAISTAPNHLGRLVVDWVRKNPGDLRAAEALHLAVKSTRFGCTDEDTTGFSREAFQLLHRRYPQSEWAKKTKYWY